jgi:type 1 glutamine amidotransferase
MAWAKRDKLATENSMNIGFTAGRLTAFYAAPLALIATFAGPASAAPDCPAALQPYSSNTVLLDLLLDPRAAAVLENDGLLKSLPAMVRTATPPTLADVMSPRWMLTSRFAGGGATPAVVARLAAMDHALGTIPITAEAAERRCARYDHARPALPKPDRHPAILVFEKINGYRENDSVAAAHRALADMAKRRNWAVTFTDNGAAFNREQLRAYDAVVWNNVSGDALTLSQRAAFKAYLVGGAGFVGIHGAAGDFTYLWPWYRDVLIGATFIGHTLGPQFRAARVVVGDRSGITAGLPDSWTMTEEWYSFAAPPAAGARILARVEESSYAPGPLLAMGDHPIAWAHCIGKARAFYTAIGHRPESYSEPNSYKLLEQGVAWAAGQGDTRCRNGREVNERSSRLR